MSFRKPFRALPVQLGPRYRAKRRKERQRLFLFPLGVLGGAALAGGVVGVLPALESATAPTGGGEVVTGCTVTDGDTIRCGGQRIRLLGIDAPEIPGHCRRGRDCAPGDPYASTASLEEAMTGELRIERVGEDRYGRTLATIKSDKGDLSCWQLEHGQAIYKPKWDDGGRIALACSTVARPGVGVGGKRSDGP